MQQYMQLIIIGLALGLGVGIFIVTALAITAIGVYVINKLTNFFDW